VKGRQLAQDFDLIRRQADLLLGLTQGSGHQVRVERIHPSAGEGDLTAMAVMGVLGPANEQQMPGGCGGFGRQGRRGG